MIRADQIAAVLEDYGVDTGYTCAAIGNGLIHETIAVSYGGAPRYVLQHLNTNVFPDPGLCARNAEVVTDRIRRAVTGRGGDLSREVLRFVPTRDGRLFTQSPDGSSWRMADFIPETVTIDVPGDAGEAGRIAGAFALFQNDLWDVPANRVRDAIPGFHDTPKRYEKFRRVAAAAERSNRAERLEQAHELVEQIQNRAELLGIIESERNSGGISTHVCHNDTKVNNVLLDETSRDPLCVIDLDTIGRGSPLMDVGDLLRTAAATASEEEQDLGRVAADPEAALAIVHAFADVLDERLNAREHQLLPFSGWIITMEQCIRYLTDYLEGDVYYGERYPGHNLCRAQNQLALARSMEESFVDLRSIR